MCLLLCWRIAGLLLWFSLGVLVVDVLWVRLD